MPFINPPFTTQNKKVQEKVVWEVGWNGGSDWQREVGGYGGSSGGDRGCWGRWGMVGCGGEVGSGRVEEWPTSSHVAVCSVYLRVSSRTPKCPHPIWAGCSPGLLTALTQKFLITVIRCPFASMKSLFPGSCGFHFLNFSPVLEKYTFQLLPEASFENFLVWKISYVFLHKWLLVWFGIEFSPQNVFIQNFLHYPVASRGLFRNVPLWFLILSVIYSFSLEGLSQFSQTLVFLEFLWAVAWCGLLFFFFNLPSWIPLGEFIFSKFWKLMFWYLFVNLFCFSFSFSI